MGVLQILIAATLLAVTLLKDQPPLVAQNRTNLWPNARPENSPRKQTPTDRSKGSGTQSISRSCKDIPARARFQHSADPQMGAVNGHALCEMQSTTPRPHSNRRTGEILISVGLIPFCSFTRAHQVVCLLVEW